MSAKSLDFCDSASPWMTESWPENVYIFRGALEAVSIQGLDCRVYGAGFRSMDCESILEGFRSEGEEAYWIALFHGDPVQSRSPYNAVTVSQVKHSGLHYLALGHVHKAGAFRSGDTLCAWPGCPMGRGYDEPGIKGVLLVTLEEEITAQFLPLNTPRFYDETLDAGEDPAQTLAGLLPPVETQDTYRVTFTGYAAPMDIAAIAAGYPHIPYLELRDRTLPEVDLWSCIEEDSLEGMFFKALHDGLDTDTTTVAIRAMLVCRNDVSEDVVYELMTSMFDNLDDLKAGHAKFANLSVETAQDGTSVPYHAGAVKFFADNGVEVK